MSVIRVVVADDSSIATERIAQILSSQVRIQIVASTHSAQALLAAVDAHAPDVVTLDLLMPDRTGLALIRELSARCCVVVVSDHDQRSTLAQESIAQGALAFIEKRALGSEAGRARLLQAVMRARGTAKLRSKQVIVAIAGSTGAIGPLELVARDLSAVEAVIALVQHLPAARVPGFASWLGTLGLRSQMVQGGEVLRAGQLYVAPGHRHLRIERGVRAQLDDSAPIKGHKPSATVLFESLRDRACDVVAVVLSGMGDDGAAALAGLVAAGARCIVQRRDTCAVSGMPDAALLAAGPRARALAPREIGPVLRAWLGDT